MSLHRQTWSKQAITSSARSLQIYFEPDTLADDTNPGFQPFGFAGGIHDPLTELIHFGLRDYDPRARRWTTPDPTGFGGGTVNLYLYGANDPIQFVDPNGDVAVLVVVAIAAVAASVGGGAGVYALNVRNNAHNSANEAGKLLKGYGVDKGPTDALRHCTMNCNLRRDHGFGIAFLASWAHEVPEQWVNLKFDNGSENPARKMDEHNNICGRAIADTQSLAIDCVDHCKQALIDGRLKMMPENNWWTHPNNDIALGRSIWESWQNP